MAETSAMAPPVHHQSPQSVPDAVERHTASAGRSAPGDLRDWLDRLSATDRLAIAKPGRALRFEIAAIANSLDGTKATFFPRPGGRSVPVVSGLVSDRGWMAEACQTTQGELIARFQAAVDDPIPWREIEDAPAQEVVHENVDLTRMLPIPTHNEHDSGAYITAGLVVTKNPESGVQNVAIHRLQVSGPDRLGVLILPRHTMAFYRNAVARGEDLPIAIVIGVDPATLLSSQAVLPLDRDELEVAGALHGCPLPVTKCLTSEIRVPARAEIVIEGRLLAEGREPEGPFGEFPQYYGERADRHVIAVDRLTHRRDPIFHTIVGGGLEHLMLGGIPREASLFGTLKRSFPGVLDIHLTRGGVCRYVMVVRLKKTSDGEGKNVLLGALASHYDVKHAIVVDEDVDIHNPIDVEWAVATRFQADRDLIVVPGAQGSKLDPSTEDGVGAKMGLDATKPLDPPEMRYKRIRVPGEEGMDLGAVLDPTASDWRAIG